MATRSVALAGRLAARDRPILDLGKSCQGRHEPVPETEKQAMIAELDALAALPYSLTERQLMQLFEIFHEG